MAKGEKAKPTTDELMRAVMKGIEQIVPGHAVVLMIAPFGVTNPRANYIANAPREEMIAMMKEVAARLEGRGHAAPVRLQ